MITATNIHRNLIFQDKILAPEDEVGLGTEVYHAVNTVYFHLGFTMLFE